MFEYVLGLKVWYVFLMFDYKLGLKVWYVSDLQFEYVSLGLLFDFVF